METINTLIYSVVPSKTIPDSRPKWAKCIPLFQTKTVQKPYPDGVEHNYTYIDILFTWSLMAYIRKYTPNSPPAPLPPPLSLLWRRTTAASQLRLSMNDFPYKSLNNPKFSKQMSVKNRAQSTVGPQSKNHFRSYLVHR